MGKWNPSPEIAAAREYDKKFDRPVVVVFSLEKCGNRFSVTTYGRSKALCTLAAEFGDQIAQAVKDGVIAPPELEPTEGAPVAQQWSRDNGLTHDALQSCIDAISDVNADCISDEVLRHLRAARKVAQAALSDAD